MSIKALIVGSGGREHALAWKLSQEAQVHVAPGNPGIGAVAECHPVSASDHEAIVALAKDLQVDFVLVGPEAPLIAGLGNRLREEGVAVFGPNADGAQLEGSKAFSKETMLAAGVPTAQSEVCVTPERAMRFARVLDEQGKNAVIKASGAALGKGVLVCSSLDEAEAAIRQVMVDREFGEAGDTVVVEERLTGREFSLLTLCSDEGFFSLPVAQDYKRAFEGDQGLNTGGMGSVSPSPWVTQEQVAETEALVVAPILEELKQRGISFRGVLFSGLLVQNDDVFCLEYNVRFGDPETQSVMPLLGSGFAEALLACSKGEPIYPLRVSEKSAVTIVLASGGYPGSYAKGKPITVAPSFPADALLFHAGTRMDGGRLVTDGGRVMAVTALGTTPAEARQSALRAAESVHFEGMHFRKDIAL